MSHWWVWRIVYLLIVSGYWFWPSQSPELRFLSQWDFENNAHSTGIEEKGLEVASEFVLCIYEDLCVIEFQRKVSKKLKDWKTFWNLSHIHIFAVFTFGMLATVPLFYQDLLEQATARLQSPESGEARMVFGRTWRIAPGRLLWEETRWSEIPPTFSMSYLPTYPSTYWPICLYYCSIYLPGRLPVCLSLYLAILSVNVLFAL